MVSAGTGMSFASICATIRRTKRAGTAGNAVVVPELDLVVAATAGNYGQYYVWEKIRTELVPAVMRAVR